MNWKDDEEIAKQLAGCRSILIEGITASTEIKRNPQGKWIGFDDETELVHFLAQCQGMKYIITFVEYEGRQDGVGCPN